MNFEHSIPERKSFKEWISSFPIRINFSDFQLKYKWYAKWEIDIIIFSFLAKTGSVGPVEQQIKFVSPNIYNIFVNYKGTVRKHYY